MMSMGMEAGAAYFCGLPSLEGLPIDDLLDFSQQDTIFDSSPLENPIESHLPHPASAFSDDIYLPVSPLNFSNLIQSEEAAELEWLSRFADDSFKEIEAVNGSFSGEMDGGDVGLAGGKARGKRSKAGQGAGSGWSVGGSVRRCTHCASEKTPQWRTGPLGPKTLCNACGVRFKSGRLVPEYRPAASPTFVLTQHSNSHRKVLELRRQKELFHDSSLH
ncbi:GATA transcription factor 2 [Wolffia australiana]